MKPRFKFKHFYIFYFTVFHFAVNLCRFFCCFIASWFHGSTPSTFTLRNAIPNYVFLLFLLLPPSPSFSQSLSPEIILQEGDYSGLAHIAYSADGTRVVAVNEHSGQIVDTQILIWDIRSGRMIFRLIHEVKGFKTNKVKDISISPEGRFVALLQGNRLYIYDLMESTTQEIIEKKALFKITEESPQALAFSPDKKYLAVVGRQIHLYTIEGHPKEWEDIHFGQSNRNIEAVDFSADGRYMFAGSKSKDLSVWDLQNRQFLKKMDDVKKPVEQLSARPDGKFVVVSSSDKNFRIWDVESGKMVKERKTRRKVEALRYSPDGKFIVGRNNKESQIRIYDANTGDEQPSLNDAVDGDARAISMNFSPDGRYLAVSGFDIKKKKKNKSFKIFDFQSKKVVKTIKLQEPTPIYSLTLNEDATKLVSYGADQYLKVWNLATSNLENLQQMPANLKSVYFTNDLKNAAYLFEDKLEASPFSTQEFYTDKKRTRATKIDTSKYDLSTVTFSLDRSYVACLAKNKSNIWVFHLANSTRAKPFYIKSDSTLNIIQLSRTGKYLAAGKDSLFHIWETTSKKLVHHNRKVPRREKSHSVEIGQILPTIEEQVFVFNCLESYERQRLIGNNTMKANDLTSMKFDILKAQETLVHYDINETLASGILEVTLGALKIIKESKKKLKSILLMEPYAISGDGSRYAMTDSPSGNSTAIEKIINKKKTASSKVYTGSFVDLMEKEIFSTDIGSQVYALAINNDGRFLATGSSDGIIKLWNSEHQQLVAEIVHQGEDFAFLLRKNPKEPYYKMSKGAGDLVVFRYGKDGYPFESFDLQFNRHDKILEALSDPQTGIIKRTENVQSLIKAYHKAYLKRTEKMGYSLANINASIQPPNPVKIESPIPIKSQQRQLPITISASDNNYPLKFINVWVNDVPVFGRDGINVSDKNAKVLTETFNIILSEGENKIQISATNQQQVRSLLETFNVTYTGPTQKPSLHLVSIGVTEFSNSAMNLNYPAKDAMDLVNLFSVQNHPNFNQIHIHSLTNQQATRANILKLKDKLKSTQVDDIVILFVASHGLVDDNFDYYLATHNINFSAPAQNGLLYEELESLLDGIPARKKLILIDACHSGEIDKASVEKIERPITEEGDVNFRAVDAALANLHVGLNNSFELMQALFEDLRRGVGATVISSASGVEFALEGDTWKNGVFTYALINGLKHKKADTNKDGKIMISELQQYLLETVVEMTGGQQKPTFRVKNRENDFAIW